MAKTKFGTHVALRALQTETLLKPGDRIDACGADPQANGNIAALVRLRYVDELSVPAERLDRHRVEHGDELLAAWQVEQAAAQAAFDAIAGKKAAVSARVAELDKLIAERDQLVKEGTRLRDEEAGLRRKLDELPSRRAALQAVRDRAAASVEAFAS